MGGDNVYEIRDKCFLFLGISMMLVTQTLTLHSVLALLLILIVMALCYLIENKNLRFVLVAGYIAIGISVPVCMLYLPLLCYELWKDGWLACLLGIVSGGYIVLSHFDRIMAVYCFGALLLVYIMQRNTQRMTSLERELKVLRDTSTERNLLLKDKNRDLIEKQNVEIHLVRLEERNRIAREIHDNVGHMLSRSLLQVGALFAINKDRIVEENLVGLKTTLKDAMNSVRESVHDLHDDSIDLELTIRDIIRGFSDYEIDFSFELSEKVEKRVKYCFITTVKEALSNVVKHSNATKVVIYLYELPGMLHLSIKDNGSVVSSNKSDGLGLSNMKERTEHLGGTFYYNNREGFQIYISIPK